MTQTPDTTIKNPIGVTTMRELLCHYLARVYEAGHRDTSYEEGETLDEALRQVNQVLGFAGYEPESKEREALLQRASELGTFPWTLPDLPEIEIRALRFVHDPDNWTDFEMCKESRSADVSPDWFLLCEAVEAKYGAPVITEDVPELSAALVATNTTQEVE